MKPEPLKIVISADARPLSSELEDLSDKLTAKVGATSKARAAALERMHRRHLAGAAETFEAQAGLWPWWRPSKYTAWWHARACRRWIRISEKAEAR